MTKDEALKLALEALRLQIDVSDWEEQEKANTASFEAITAIREALSADALAEQPYEIGARLAREMMEMVEAKLKEKNT